MEKKVAPTITITERLSWICNTVFHQSFAVISIFLYWTIFYYSKIDSILTWHAFLSSIGYLPFMGEAIILFSNDNVWSLKIERKTKYALHGGLLFLCAILITVGIALIVNDKDGNHFQSTHAWTGLVSWIFVLLSQCLGLAAAYTQTLSGIIRPVYVKFIHNLFGMLGYVFGVVSLLYGLDKNSIKRNTSEESRSAAVWVLSIATAWSLLAAVRSLYNQLKTILSSAEVLKKISF